MGHLFLSSFHYFGLRCERHCEKFSKTWMSLFFNWCFIMKVKVTEGRGKNNRSKHRTGAKPESDILPFFFGCRKTKFSSQLIFEVCKLINSVVALYTIVVQYIACMQTTLPVTRVNQDQSHNLIQFALTRTEAPGST